MAPSITRRTAWQIGGLLGGLLAVFVGVTWWVVVDAWQQGIDQKLWSQARAVAALCSWEAEEEWIECELEPSVIVDLGLGKDLGITLRALTGPRRGEPMFYFGLQPPSGMDPLPPLDTPVDVMGQRVLRAELPVADFPVPGVPRVEVMVTADLGPLHQRNQRLLRYLGMVGAGCLGLGLLLGAALARRVLRPIQDLGAAAKQIAAGGAVEVPRSGNGDEVDQVAALVERAFRVQADSLDRQARFTADAAHELRNPIAGIRTAAEVASREERSADELARFLRDITGHAARMGQTVDALLELARLDAGATQLQWTEVHLEDLLCEGAEDPRIEIQCPDVSVQGDRRLLEILVRNLLENAVRHCAGRVVVRAARLDGLIHLDVMDDGPGFQLPEPEQLLERFRRADPSTRGAGLGLSICAEIVAAHGGSLRLAGPQKGDTPPEKRTLQGARVRISLPMDGRRQQEATSPKEG